MLILIIITFWMVTKTININIKIIIHNNTILITMWIRIRITAIIIAATNNNNIINNNNYDIINHSNNNIIVIIAIMWILMALLFLIFISILIAIWMKL